MELRALPKIELHLHLDCALSYDAVSRLAPSVGREEHDRDPDWESHPIDRLSRAGVPLNANTDSRMLTPATLTGEFEGLGRVFGWAYAATPSPASSPAR